MLGSREDAEDVLQEVFAAAFNAVLADEREINVRPWLYRIARNRSLNHLRRASAIGVDSMDVHFADHGLSTGDRAIRRESFRELLADVQQLPETQRTALLLREIDALSYEQIADAMETTVPSVKSLLVRARISLAEAAEARKLNCSEVRLELGEVAEGLIKLSSPARRHVRDCERCGSFKKQLKDNNHALAAMLPVGPLLLVKKLLLAKLGSTASAGGAHVAGGAGATIGAGAAAGRRATGGTGVAGGILTAGAGAIATKAVAGLAAAAIVTAGAVAVDHTSQHPTNATARAPPMRRAQLAGRTARRRASAPSRRPPRRPAPWQRSPSGTRSRRAPPQPRPPPRRPRPLAGHRRSAGEAGRAEARRQPGHAGHRCDHPASLGRRRAKSQPARSPPADGASAPPSAPAEPADLTAPHGRGSHDHPDALHAAADQRAPRPAPDSPAAPDATEGSNRQHPQRDLLDGR